jgi:hypothetical protein
MLKRLESSSQQPPSRSGPETHRVRLEYRYERLVSIAQELAPLAVSHYAGLPEAIKRLPLDVDWERCLAADLQGFIHVLTVRAPEDNNRLVGYVANQVVRPFMHNGSKWAFVEAIYLADEYREGWVGYQMLKKNFKGMATLGCDVCKVFCPIDTFEPLLKRLGCEFLELGAFKFLR